MNYAECLSYLAELGSEIRGVKFGLEAIETILASLGQAAYLATVGALLVMHSRRRQPMLGS